MNFKFMIGRVVSTKMNKTATVLAQRLATHPLYKKTFTRSKKYPADDLIGVKEGDVVEIVKVKPISKNKHWRITKVIGKNLEAITVEKLKAGAEEVIAEATSDVAKVMPEEKTEKELSNKNQELSNKKKTINKKKVKIKKEAVKNQGLRIKN